jgi:hypothetical protein
MISEKEIFCEGGSSDLILGTKAIKPRTKVAIDPNFSSTEVLVWRKMKILSRASMNIGMKIVAQAFPGNL